MYQVRSPTLKWQMRSFKSINRNRRRHSSPAVLGEQSRASSGCQLRVPDFTPNLVKVETGDTYPASLARALSESVLTARQISGAKNFRPRGEEIHHRKFPIETTAFFSSYRPPAIDPTKPSPIARQPRTTSLRPDFDFYLVGN